MKVFLAGRQTLSDAVENSGLIGGSVQISEGDLFKWGGHIGLRIFDAAWLEFGGERIIRGQNIGAGTGWNVGLVYIH